MSRVGWQHRKPKDRTLNMPFRISLSMGSKFVDECLKAHNDYRRKHGVPVLKHNKEITVIAQKWADHLARSGSFQHSTNRELKGQRLGENIAMKWDSSGEDYTGGQVTEQWYDEIKKYNFRTHSGAGTGHFTQVVWRDSREFGVGKAQAKDGKWVVVANYLPAGNMMGQHANNVYPVGGGSGSGTREESGASSPGLFGSLFGKKPDSKCTTVVRETNRTGGPANSVFGYRGTTTSVSRSVRTETVNGRTVTKTVITETTVGPDGRRTVSTREEVNEGGGSEMDADFERRFKNLSFDSAQSRQPGHNPNTQHVYTHHTSHGNPTSTEQPASHSANPADGVKPKGTGRTSPEMKTFIEDVVKAHNAYRKKHGKVGDLKNNASLNDLAQQWAEKLAASGVLKHSGYTYRGEHLGENVASKWGSRGVDYTGQEVTGQWYDEIKKFDFNRNEFGSGTGHFTQVVWKGSKEIGVGKAGSNGQVFVVCNYFPGGNVVGHFNENVFPA